MHIQPYFPEQIEVSRNAAGERYIVTLSYVRAVMAGHFVTALAVAGVAVLAKPTLDLQSALTVFLGSLLLLTIVRRVLDGGWLDNGLSLLLMAPTAWSLGAMARIGLDAGLPLWIPAAAYAYASVYGALCGRDLSFVGQYVIAAAGLLVTVLGALVLGLLEWQDATLWTLVALVYNFYFVYDLAALLSRRRLGEEPAAVADLYRDMLNALTYSVRVYLHWRRYRFA
jgi:hypothetical protein